MDKKVVCTSNKGYEKLTVGKIYSLVYHSNSFLEEDYYLIEIPRFGLEQSSGFFPKFLFGDVKEVRNLKLELLLA